MRILCDNVFVDILNTYSTEKDRLGCIVMRTAQRRKSMKENFYRRRELMNISICDNVIVFRDTRSKIFLCCLANRPTIMFDDVIADGMIESFDTLLSLAQLERPKVVVDFGVLEPSIEILDYIGGLCG